MERSVIHYNHGAFFTGWQKLFGKPCFKEPAVHCSAILEWCKNFILHFSGNNASAFVFSTVDPGENLLSTGYISIFTVQVSINTTFIHIGDFFWWYILDLFLIRRYFLPVLLLIPSSQLNLKVDCHFTTNNAKSNLKTFRPTIKV